MKTRKKTSSRRRAPARKRTGAAAKQNPRPRRRRLTLAPLRKVINEAGAKSVQVVRSRSGKPIGLRFRRR